MTEKFMPVRAALSKSPMQESPKLQRSISPILLSDTRSDITPGCTDYTPRHDKILKHEPVFAP